jgi:ribosomal protein L5
MERLQRLYLLNSRKDLVSKLNLYKNVNQISSIKYVNLSFSELKNKFSVALALAFLCLISNKKGKFNLKSRFSFSKTHGCSLKLKREEAFFFLENFLFFNLKNILDLEEGFSKSSFSETGTFSFTVKDVYAFSELGDNLFKLRILKNLNIAVLFSSQNRGENIQLLKSLGFLFKN